MKNTFDKNKVFFSDINMHISNVKREKNRVNYLSHSLKFIHIEAHSHINTYIKIKSIP